MSRLLFSCVLTGLLGASSAWAHHETPGRSHAVATVTLNQQVLAGGEPLAPGTYEIWITDEKPEFEGEISGDLQRVVHFVQNGQIIRREVAELMPPERLTADGRVGTTAEIPVGTSGATGMARARVQELRSGDYVRISITDGGVRYLIHLPTGPLNEPAPQPQEKTRIVLPPQPVQP